MSDNRTTELLRKLLDERGVKYSDFTSATRNGKAIFKTRWKHECGYAELSEWESTGSNNLFIQNVDPEQAIAATLGSDKPPYDELLRCLENDWHISASWDGLRKFWCVELTEEGVRMRDARAEHGTLTAEHVREVIERHVKFYEGGDYDEQAIADELNARAERTCQRFWTGAEMICSSCAYQLNNGAARYCPNCGAKVVDE